MFFGAGEPSPVYVRGTDVRLVRKVAKRGSMISFVSSFEAGGRSWLLTPDLTAVPADRVRVYRPSSFHGVALGDETVLPLAWVRWRPAAKVQKDADGRFAKTGFSWPVRAAVPLSEERVIDGGVAYLGTTEAGTFVAENSVVVVRTARSRPPVVGPDEKWIQISISKGTLTAYQGDRPVFATLVSPGRGGVPQGMSVPVGQLAQDGSTPLGTYRIQYKDRFAIMSPDPEQKKYFLADVPHVQYFFGPFALHAAYWHEDFGEPRSGGCVNLAPSDAQWLFGWTEPFVPDGWQAARATGPNGLGTAVQITP
jgi:lipoprotein-anchoring transpeptidase ErfK/SrfK